MDKPVHNSQENHLDHCALCGRPLAPEPHVHNFGPDGFLCPTCGATFGARSVACMLDDLVSLLHNARFRCGGDVNKAKQLLTILLYAPALRRRLNIAQREDAWISGRGARRSWVFRPRRFL